MKATEVLKRIMTELSSVKEEAVVEVKFAQMNLENGTVLEAEAFEVGNEVFIVNEEDRIALPVGEYTLADGNVLYVTEEGVIAEIKSAEAEQEEEVAEVAAEPVAELEADAPSNPKKIVESHTTETHFAEELPMEEKIKAIVMPIIEEVKAELSAIREEMGYTKEKMSAVEAENNELKTELSAQSAAKPIKHNPEVAPKAEVKFATRKPQTAMNRVLSKLNK
jgi:regulator of replication initiation timing